MDNRYGFNFGFELEVNSLPERHANRYVVDNPYWLWCHDGSGIEFKTRTSFDNLNRFMEEFRKLAAFLKENGATVSHKQRPEDSEDASYSPRGIHVHVSHPSRQITMNYARKIKAISMIPPMIWTRRREYCDIQMTDHKYSAINIYSRTSGRIELRCYNATLNMRAVAHILNNAQEVANVAYDDLPIKMTRGGVQPEIDGVNRPRRRRPRRTGELSTLWRT